MKRRVLFVCTANSARSLMAEALLRELAGDQFEVASAGTEPDKPHPMALQVLSESGFSVDGLQSKSLAGVESEHWDYVITLCEKAANECGNVCQPAQQIAWDFPDPVPSGRHATFALTLKEIREPAGERPGDTARRFGPGPRGMSAGRAQVSPQGTPRARWSTAG